MTASIAIIWKARPRINRARRYFTPKHRLALYRAQVRPHMEYCFHLWAGAPQYQLEPFDRIQRRVVQIIRDPMICERLDTLALRRDMSSLCFLYRIYHGECSEELFDLSPAAEFSNRTIRHKLKHHPHHLIRSIPLLCCFVGTSFHAPRNSGMASRGSAFRLI